MYYQSRSNLNTGGPHRSAIHRKYKSEPIHRFDMAVVGNESALYVDNERNAIMTICPLAWLISVKLITFRRNYVYKINNQNK